MALSRAAFSLTCSRDRTMDNNLFINNFMATEIKI